MSYAYQKIDAVSRQLAAEDKLRKQEAAKQYYTDLASMNKEQIGVRAADMPEISSMYKQWAANEKKISQSPNLITKNPEEYGRLKAESDALYSKLRTNIQASKDFGKREVEEFRIIRNPEKMDLFKDGAAEEYKARVLSSPLSRIMETGDDDLAKYYETRIDGSGFLNKIDASVRTNGLGINQKLDKEYKSLVGEKKYNIYDKMPMIESIYTMTRNGIDGEFGKKANTFANQQLTDLRQSGEYDAVVTKFNNFWNPANKDGAVKYYDSVPDLPPMFKPGASAKQQYIDFVTASQFLAKLPTSAKEDYEMTPTQKLAYKKLGFRPKDAEAPADDSGYINAYDEIANYLAADPVRKIGSSVDRFNTGTQKVILEKARIATGINWLSNRDVYVKADDKTGELVMLSLSTIPKPDGTPLYVKDQRIGTLPRMGTNMAASKPLGIQGVRTAEAKSRKPSAPPPAKAVTPTNKPKIKGF
ncbi:MAG: hypothetical protein ACRCW1_01715 [Anaerotignaceae bacterium]